MGDHKCPQNKTRNEVWPETDWCKPMLVLVGGTETGHFEHSERINFCPYCGKDLRREEGVNAHISAKKAAYVCNSSCDKERKH